MCENSDSSFLLCTYEKCIALLLWQLTALVSLLGNNKKYFNSFFSRCVVFVAFLCYYLLDLIAFISNIRRWFYFCWIRLMYSISYPSIYVEFNHPSKFPLFLLFAHFFLSIFRSFIRNHIDRYTIAFAPWYACILYVLYLCGRDKYMKNKAFIFCLMAATV